MILRLKIKDEQVIQGGGMYDLYVDPRKTVAVCLCVLELELEAGWELWIMDKSIVHDVSLQGVSSTVLLFTYR